MAISAVAVTTTDTLETFRVEFNNLVADVASIEQVGASNIIISDGGNIGSASDQDAIAIASTGVVTFSQTPSFTAGITVSNLDIDGGTDIGAAIVDADLFIVDDGASGTNRKTAASRIKTYIADVTLTTAAQTAITSVGTLTALHVDNINVNGNTISASSGAVNITPAGGSAIVLDGTINVDAGVVTGVTSLTSNNILIADAGTIGSASDTDAISISSGGVVGISATTTNTSTTTGALTVAGGVGIAENLTVGDKLRLKSDGAQLFFGASGELKFEHVADTGLTLTHSGGTGDNLPIVFQLKSEEDAIIADEVIASLEFAAGDSDGTDGATVAAGIHAIAEGTFSASANATRLSFTTGVSETAAASATAKMTLSSAGNLGIGTTTPSQLLHVRSAGDAVLFLEADTDNSGEDDNAKIILSQDGGLSLARIGFADNTNTLEFYNELTPSTDSHIRFGTDNTERMKILQGGDVEIHADLLMDHDSARISFGADDEIRLTHDHNKGLVLTNSVNGTDDTPVIFRLKSEEDAIVAADVIASIEFAAGDSDGTDGATIAAGIHAIAEGTFSASANATKLVFTTGVSETAAASATAKMTLSSAGLLTIADDFVIKDGGTIGSASDADAIAIAADGVVTMNQIPVFSAGINVSGGSIAGTLSTAAQTNITSLGTLTALTVDDVVINGKVLTITGDTDDTFTITSGTHGATTLATVDTAGASGSLTLDADGLINFDAGDSDGQFRFLASGTRYGTIFKSGNSLLLRSDISDGDILIQGNDGGSYITAVTFDMSNLGSATFNNHITVGDNIALASDSPIIYFGASSEIRLTHIHDTGLTLSNHIADTDNRPIVLQLKSEEDAIVADDVIASIEMAAGDSDGTDGATVAAGIHAIAEDTFSASANATKLVFTTGVSETAASSATAKMTLSSAGLLTIADDFVIKDGGTIGSASDTDAIAIAADGVVTMNQIPVFSAGINVSGGTIAGTLATVAQTNITSLGTLTALTVDDINLNGKVVTITGDTSDTFTITAGAAGATTLATTDAAGADGFIHLDADGIIILDAGDASGTVRISKTGTRYVTILESSGTAVIRANVSDGDILFQGNDGGSTITALTLDMSDAGTAYFNNDVIIADELNFTSDSATIYFGVNNDILLSHVHNVGLTLTHNAAGDNLPIVLQLKSQEDAIIADEVIGSLEFAAGDSDGTDGATVAAGIHAIAEDTFSASANATKLVFTTGVSETAASSATAKMTLSSAGLLTIADDFMIKDGGTIGVASTNDAMTISSAGIVTFKDDIIIKDAGTIGSASAPSAITISDAGRVTFSAEIRLASYIAIDTDNRSIFFGANDEIRLTHVHDVGLTVTNAIADTDNKPVVFQLKSEEDAIVADDVIASIEMAAGDSDGTDGATVAAGIHAIAEDTFSASANATKLVFTTGVSETAAASATAKMALSSAGNLTIVGELTTPGFSSTDFAAAFIVIEDGGTDGGGTDAGDNLIDETDSDDLLMENITSWVTSGFTIRDSFGNHLQTVNGVS